MYFVFVEDVKMKEEFKLSDKRKELYDIHKDVIIFGICGGLFSGLLLGLAYGIIYGLCSGIFLGVGIGITYKLWMMLK